MEVFPVRSGPGSRPKRSNYAMNGGCNPDWVFFWRVGVSVGRAAARQNKTRFGNTTPTKSPLNKHGKNKTRSGRQNKTGPGLNKTQTQAHAPKNHQLKFYFGMPRHAKKKLSHAKTICSPSNPPAPQAQPKLGLRTTSGSICECAPRPATKKVCSVVAPLLTC